MQALLLSIGVVALAEIGDKTQLLAIVLAARWRKPWPIIGGIAVATVLNHGLASVVGVWAGHYLQGPWIPWVLGLAFFGFALWALIPDRLDQSKVPQQVSSRGVLVATVIAFFVVEMGDKTQVATVALAAQFQSIVWVTAGTTLGMMIANVPAVLIGDAVAQRLPMKQVRMAAACLFAAVGLWIILSR